MLPGMANLAKVVLHTVVVSKVAAKGQLAAMKNQCLLSTS